MRKKDEDRPKGPVPSKEDTFREGPLKGGINTPPTTPRPPDPKGQGKKRT